MLIRVAKLRPHAVLPTYRSDGAVAMDLHLAAWTYPESVGEWFGHRLVIDPLERVLVGTGIAIEIPPGFEGQVRARSGHALGHGLVVLNAPGTIDQDYRGEVCVVLGRVSDPDDVVQQSCAIEIGDRIAQLVIAPVVRGELIEVDNAALSVTERGSKGFGSTGQGLDLPRKYAERWTATGQIYS